MRYIFRTVARKTSSRDHMEEIGADGRIILECIFDKWGVKVGLDVTGSRCGPMMEYYEHSNEQALTY
jgi:hypothetical protein